jgi:hypothetical protein
MVFLLMTTRRVCRGGQTLQCATCRVIICTWHTSVANRLAGYGLASIPDRGLSLRRCGSTHSHTVDNGVSFHGIIAPGARSLNLTLFNVDFISVWILTSNRAMFFRCVVLGTVKKQKRKLFHYRHAGAKGETSTGCSLRHEPWP